jgi:hypothetical protein
LTDERQVPRIAQDDNSHLETLAALPRPVGSQANAESRRYCADHLRSLGFEVAERPFVFSALPGRFAAQIIGAVAVSGFAAALYLFAPWFGQLTVAVIAALALWLGSPGATNEPWLSEKGVNLEAIRSGSPRVWLVAHIDSKSQPVSSGIRALGVLAIFVASIGQLVAPWYGERIINWIGILGGAVLLMASVGSNSDGAADNASGVAAVLGAVSLIPPSVPVGVLITDAEELSLAGARNWVAARSEKAFAINCDTIDDQGELMAIAYGGGRELAAKARPLVARVLRPAYLPGVLTDSNAFNSAGWATLTLGRGTLRTLNRIHTRRDSLDNLRGTGIPGAARVLARLVEELA